MDFITVGALRERIIWQNAGATRKAQVRFDAPFCGRRHKASVISDPFHCSTKQGPAVLKRDKTFSDSWLSTLYLGAVVLLTSCITDAKSAAGGQCPGGKTELKLPNNNNTTKNTNKNKHTHHHNKTPKGVVYI